jgi:hypothetical protein
MIKKIMLSSGTIIEVNENSQLTEMERNCPLFFEKAHGQRESKIIYRGQVIVRNTVNFSDGPHRMTAAYIYTKDLEGSPDLFCISSGSKCNSISGAQKLIDRVLDSGRYFYGV